MALSGWPEGWEDTKRSGGGGRNQIVEIEFADEMFVAVVTEYAIGLKETADDVDVAYWIPIALIDGDVPERGDWIKSIDIPEWKADELGF